MEHSRGKQIREAAKKAGVEVLRIEEGKKHVKVYLASGRFVTCGKTPGDIKANLNLVKDMRKERSGINPRK